MDGDGQCRVLIRRLGREIADSPYPTDDTADTFILKEAISVRLEGDGLLNEPPSLGQRVRRIPRLERHTDVLGNEGRTLGQGQDKVRPVPQHKQHGRHVLANRPGIVRTRAGEAQRLAAVRVPRSGSERSLRTVGRAAARCLSSSRGAADVFKSELGILAVRARRRSQGRHVGRWPRA